MATKHIRVLLKFTRQSDHPIEETAGAVIPGMTRLSISQTCRQHLQLSPPPLRPSLRTASMPLPIKEKAPCPGRAFAQARQLRSG